MKIISVLLVALLFFSSALAEELPELVVEITQEKVVEEETFFDFFEDGGLKFTDNEYFTDDALRTHLDNLYFYIHIDIFNVFSRNRDKQEKKILTTVTDIKSPTSHAATLGFKLRFSVGYSSD